MGKVLGLMLEWDDPLRFFSLFKDLHLFLVVCAHVYLCTGLLQELSPVYHEMLAKQRVSWALLIWKLASHPSENERRAGRGGSIETVACLDSQPLIHPQSWDLRWAVPGTLLGFPVAHPLQTWDLCWVVPGTLRKASMTLSSPEWRCGFCRPCTCPAIQAVTVSRRWLLLYLNLPGTSHFWNILIFENNI